MARAKPTMAIRFRDGPDGRAEACIARNQGREVTWPRVQER